jgi:uncharacterized protein YhdP
MNQTPAPIASATRSYKTLAAVARLLLWWVLAGWGLFAITWGVLHLFIVPRIGEWRPELERWASASVGVPVRVGSLSAEPQASASGLLPNLMPILALRDVQLFDPQGRPALQLPLVRATVSVGSLWRRGFEQIVIDQPVLDVRRTAQGRIEVAGLDFSDAGNDRGGADWFFSQSQFVIEGGTVRWTDDLRRQPPLALDALHLVVRNTARSHHLRLDATPPPDWGQRFSLRARLREPLLDLARNRAPGQAPWQRWDGELYADFARVDVAQLRAYVDLSDWGVEVRTGQGALRAWADVARGQISGATADVALQGVAVQLGPQLPPLLLDDITGRLAAQWDHRGFDLSTHQLRFRTREGAQWPGGVLHLKQTHASAQRPASLALTADQLDLAALSAIASRLPLAANFHSLLARLQPAGRVEGLSASWQGVSPPEPDPASAPGPAPEPLPVHAPAPWPGGSYQAKGRVVGLALAGEPSGQMSISGQFPLPGRPGVQGATVDFDLDQDGGRAQLRLQNGSLDLPGVFEETRLPLTRLEAEATWRIEGERIDVAVDGLRLANADTEGTAQLRWHTSDPQLSPSGGRFPGVLDLSATLSRATATRIHRYLPLTVDPDTRRYLREAVRGGSASQINFRVQGDLYDMPFDTPAGAPTHATAEAPTSTVFQTPGAAPTPTGVFRIGAQLQGLDFAYVPAHLQSADELAWPGLRGVSGQLVLDRAALQLSALQGGIEGAPNVQLSEASIRIDDMNPGAVLVVNARAQGPGQELLGFVRNSPLNAMTDQALAQTRASGSASVQFQLSLPFSDLPATRVAGSVQLQGNDLHISPDAPLLGRASGSVQFSETGFSVSAAQARLYGGEVRFEGGLRPDANGQPRLQFRGQGTASAEGLREANLGFVSRLFDNASGSAAYTAQLGFRAGLPELQISSNLQGMALHLPAPLDKSADASLPVRFESQLLSVVNDQAHTDRLFIQLGAAPNPLASLQFERDLRGDSPRVLRGSVAVGLVGHEAAPLPAEGVLGNIRLDTLHLDDWQRALASATGPDTRSAHPALHANGNANADLSYLPTSLALRADRLTVAGRVFNGVVLGGVREGTQWRANIDADELNGYVAYRQPSPGNAGSVFARLARLNLAPTVATDVEQLLQQPASVPALDIAVDALQLGSRRLGRVEVEAVNRASPGGSEWRLTKLQLSVPEARLSASGNWAVQTVPNNGNNSNNNGSALQRRTAVSFGLDISDSGQLLARFGHPGAVRGGKGRIQGNIGWLGSPLALDYPSLSGQLQLDIERGQFLKVDPGAAKLLGVLSLQALPRRLALDFRDVFSEGFAFDFVRGDARIDHGVLFTNNLQMKGVNAAVLMEGSADLAREQQDLNVVVVPEINAGTASLIASAINPAVGLGSFLAQFLLRQPLQSATTQEFHITGGWADPQIETIQRVLPAAANPANPPAAVKP